jgi:hypothetical protein
MYSNDPSTCVLCGDTAGQHAFHFECFTLNKRHLYYPLAGSAVHPQCLAEYPHVEDFLDFYFATVLDVFLGSFWALVPVGDEFTECFDSTLCEIEPPEYESAQIIESLLELGWIQQSSDSEKCRLLWEANSEAIEFISDAAGVWRGAEVVMQCKPETFLAHWRHVHRRFDRIYLHNQDCAIFAPDYFEAVYVNQPLRTYQRQIAA